MKIVATDRRLDRIAQQRLLVIRQQELAAELYRKGQKQRAREARSTLYGLLNQLDLMQETSLPSPSSSSRDNAA